MTQQPITYHSTRTTGEPLAFDDVLLSGLAPDGGLYMPSHLPQFSPEELVDMAALHYTQLACRVLAPFVGGAIYTPVLQRLIEESYASFRHAAITPLSQIDHREFVLELWHGPTLAFKDVALQLLGRLMDHVLGQRGQRLVILGATSGDTGSAAIAGCQGRENMDIVILYPHGRVSDVQRRQMTTVSDANVHCLAIDGTFDDCQHIVKQLFVDTEFRRQVPLGAVNSINWARIMAQIVYYIYAGLQLGAPGRAMTFSVPTGNFGDIYAGYLAAKMGLPVQTLMIASNSNDLLPRCVSTGRYEVRDVHHTLSPSMDIGVSSNFERLLCDLHGGDREAVAALMNSLRQSGGFDLSADAYRQLRRDFSATHISDAQTLDTMKSVYHRSGYLLDPHTAIGVEAMRRIGGEDDSVRVALATAHPAKFPDAVRQATGIHPDLPSHLADLHEREERMTRIPADIDAVKAVIAGLWES